MEIYNLSFNTVIYNVQDECTVFFCPSDCRFMKTMLHDLDVTIEQVEIPYHKDTICPGKVYNACPTKRLPTVYVREYDFYCDITVVVINDRFVQVIIYKNSEFKDIQDVASNYDPHKVYYEYVGSIADLKARANFEFAFMDNVKAGMRDKTRDESFAACVDELIIKKMYK